MGWAQDTKVVMLLWVVNWGNVIWLDRYNSSVNILSKNHNVVWVRVSKKRTVPIFIKYSTNIKFEYFNRLLAVKKE
jgi:hypothetical protein